MLKPLAGFNELAALERKDPGNGVTPESAFDLHDFGTLTWLIVRNQHGGPMDGTTAKAPSRNSLGSMKE